MLQPGGVWWGGGGRALPPYPTALPQPSYVDVSVDGQVFSATDMEYAIIGPAVQLDVAPSTVTVQAALQSARGALGLDGAGGSLGRICCPSIGEKDLGTKKGHRHLRLPHVVIWARASLEEVEV